MLNFCCQMIRYNRLNKFNIKPNNNINKGGRVKEVHGTHRVYLALDDVPGLAMSRSLGDYVAHSAGGW